MWSGKLKAALSLQILTLALLVSSAGADVYCSNPHGHEGDRTCGDSCVGFSGNHTVFGYTCDSSGNWDDLDAFTFSEEAGGCEAAWAACDAWCVEEGHCVE